MMLTTSTARTGRGFLGSEDSAAATLILTFCLDMTAAESGRW